MATPDDAVAEKIAETSDQLANDYPDVGALAPIDVYCLFKVTVSLELSMIL